MFLNILNIKEKEKSDQEGQIGSVLSGETVYRT